MREDRTGKGVATIGVAFLAHCLLAISLTATYPEASAACLPDGAAYWESSRTWITSGHDPEYEPRNWVPAHLQLLVVMIAFSYLSLGLAPFTQGFYQVDLMNYYVGRLVAGSSSGGVAMGLGWHTWSVMRGLCYTVLVFEVASWSFSRLTGRELSTPTRRRWRWGIALGFFLLDCLLKYFMLEPVRGQLEANLIR